MERLEAMARVKGIANSAMAKELMLRALDDETISARGPKSQGATSERPGTEMAELRARLDVVESRLDATLKQLKP
jgi:L-2-hydroxyglutarate oxidase LhgO